MRHFIYPEWRFGCSHLMNLITICVWLKFSIQFIYTTCRTTSRWVEKKKFASSKQKVEWSLLNASVQVMLIRSNKHRSTRQPKNNSRHVVDFWSSTSYYWLDSLIDQWWLPCRHTKLEMKSFFKLKHVGTILLDSNGFRWLENKLSVQWKNFYPDQTGKLVSRFWWKFW